MCLSLIFAAVAAITCISLSSGSKESLRFDDNFLFGVATAAYQVEGAWNEDGKGETIWDHVLHEHPEYIADKENGDVAADSYHQYARDVEMVKEMNMDFYRFSISWARVLPNGDMSIRNEKGLKYYSDLIDELLANGIEPVVTMYHWDLPYALQELGGWANRHIALYFRDYADLLYRTYGNRVKWWITFNEPQAFCPGYSGEYNVPPSVKMSGVGNYLCGHSVLLAHAYAYHLYNELYRSSQKGEVGITYSAGWSIPKTELDPDIAAADRSMQFWLGWFANPIVSHEGDYPQVMRQRIAENSRKEGLRRSRLPHFTQEEIQWIRGTADFVGVNHYTSHYAADGEGGKSPSFFRDAGIKVSQNSSWPSTGSAWLKVTPTGFRDLLNWIQKSYKIPKILITENGYSDKEGYLNDTDRIEYFKLYLAEIHKAKYIDGVNVIGYTAWSLMDNFEWLNGYTEKFGLYHVDFSSSQRTRSPKESATYFGKVAKTHRISRAISNYNVSFTLYLCFFISAVILRMI